MYSAIIFDLDGTLLDTIEYVSECMNTVLEKHGYPTHTVETYKAFMGEGLRKLIRRSIPPEVTDLEQMREMEQEMKHLYHTNGANRVAPYDGIHDLLQTLEERNIQLGILSNKVDEFTREHVEKIFPHINFEAVYGARDDVPLKPEPDGALEIAEIMDVDPEKVLFVGDMPTDMKTANNARMGGVAVLWGFSTYKALRESGAQYFVEHPNDILELI